jgi:hypothetical protein
MDGEAIRAGMAYLIAIGAGFAFGDGDQYRGSLTAGSVLGTWTRTVSGISAPWLVLPFVAGITQERARWAAVTGLVATMAALAGYFAMSHSPLDGAPLGQFWSRVFTMIRTGYNPLWIASGLVTGPSFGLLGQRWRVDRSWLSAAIVPGALCLEPLARLLVGMLSPPPVVWGAEIALGAVAAVGFVLLIASARRARETVT